MRNKRISKKDIEHNLLNLQQITFEVTDACNLECKYCGYGDLYYGYDKRDTVYMKFEQAKKILDYLFDIWSSANTDSAKQKTYISFYGGEPLMNMKLIKQIVEYVENSDISRNFIFSMTTNAMLLDKYMDYLVEKKINLLISLDGDEKGNSYRVTKSGDNSFKHVFANVKLLQQRYPDYFIESVNFNSVLHNRNGVEVTHEFIKKEFGKQPTIAELNNSSIQPEKVEEFLRTYQNFEESLLSSENYQKISEDMFISEPNTSDLLKYLHNYSGNVFKNYNHLFIDRSKLEIIPTGTCVPFAKKMFITVNGKILQCERIDHDFTLGDITEAGVNLDIDNIVNQFNIYLEKLKKQCDLCFRKEACAQCLFYIVNIDGEDPKCNGFMNEEMFERYSSHCLSHLANRPELYKKIMEEVLVN